MKRLVLVFACLVAVTSGSFAQDSGPKTSPPDEIFIGTVPLASGALRHLTLLNNVDQGGLPDGEFAFVSSEMMVSGEVIKNAPYSATAVTEKTQTLADGTRITNKSSVFMARDSQGRMRREDTLGEMEPLHVARTKMFVISDPVSHTDYFVLPDAQTATVLKHDDGVEAIGRHIRKKIDTVVSTDIRRAEQSAELQAEKAAVKNEDLGAQEIEGLACQGRRETVTIPSGQIGNDRPIAITTEVWISQDLHGIVLKKHSDPRFGDTEYRLTNIKLSEPDASLFQIPSGYKTGNGEPVVIKDKE
ncbi:MAG TPA: hypothetical protein VI488_02210 [Candidatus Angelobacter sp.]